MLPQKFNASEISRKDKRRHILESKVTKIYSGFITNKDTHYKNRLTSLQTNLTTLHQGKNKEFLRSLRDLEEARDLELIRLRLYEEYRVSRSSIEFQEDIEKAKNEHESLVKLCKERLYESIEKRIKSLQEERLLMDVANAHSYAMDYNRTRFQKNTRSHAATDWESSSNTEFAGNNRDSANDSATDTGTERRSLRRRVATKYAMGGGPGTKISGMMDDQSDFQTGYSTAGGNGSVNQAGESQTDMYSDTDFLQYVSDNSDLHLLLFGESGNKEAQNNKKKPKNSQRYSTKSAPPLQSLQFDEVTEDIAVIRQLTGQPPAPFKVKTDI